MGCQAIIWRYTRWGGEEGGGRLVMVGGGGEANASVMLARGREKRIVW